MTAPLIDLAYMDRLFDELNAFGRAEGSVGDYGCDLAATRVDAAQVHRVKELLAARHCYDVSARKARRGHYTVRGSLRWNPGPLNRRDFDAWLARLIAQSARPRHRTRRRNPNDQPTLFEVRATA